MPTIGRMAGEQSLRLLTVVALALSLGACSKCDVMPWHRDSAPAPQSCHDGPAAK
ncbi:MAG: hypothetical protein P4L80_01280 [Xanthobacteraceae bacterium]|nr:hypothetical protein [Xanthobacteraceae bacterium]